MASKIDLFDRLIDVTLIKADKSTVKIQTPRTGIKPKIVFSGSIVADAIYNAELRISNLYTPDDLLGIGGGSTYNWIRVECGYGGSGMLAAMEGQIWVATQESPSPDGETYFSFMSAPVNAWYNNTISLHYSVDTPVLTILNYIVSELRANSPECQTVSIRSAITSDEHHIGIRFDFDGTISEACIQLGYLTGLAIVPDGLFIRVYPRFNYYNKKALAYELDYYTEIKQTAAGFTITAPFDPRPRMGDVIKISPDSFKKSDFSGMITKFNGRFYVINTEFAFSTVGDTNRMVMTTVGEQR